MKAVSAPADVSAGAEIHSLAQPGKASVTSAGISCFLLEEFPQHPGEQL